MEKGSRMKRAFNIIFILAIAGALWVTYNHPDWVVGGIPKALAQTVDTKSDGECSGLETTGRCADKCPDGTAIPAGPKDYPPCNTPTAATSDPEPAQYVPAENVTDWTGK